MGHVVTHLARNADSHTRMLRAALDGHAVEQYAGGREERAGSIEAGAGRAGLRAASKTRSGRSADLESAWAAMTPAAWDGHGLSRGRPWPCRAMPYFRWREVEIHHVDLGAGYGPQRLARGVRPARVATDVGDGARTWPTTPPKDECSWPGSRVGPPPPANSTWPVGSLHPGNYFKGISD